VDFGKSVKASQQVWFYQVSRAKKLKGESRKASTFQLIARGFNLFPAAEEFCRGRFWGERLCPNGFSPPWLFYFRGGKIFP
jgi:hypothetical protein